MENINVKDVSNKQLSFAFRTDIFSQQKEPILSHISFIADSEEENDDVKDEVEDLEISDI